MRSRNPVLSPLRSLLRSPGFTLAVVVTLAVGIGANIAPFSVYDAVVLRRLHYPETGRLAVLRTDLVPVLGEE